MVSLWKAFWVGVIDTLLDRLTRVREWITEGHDG